MTCEACLSFSAVEDSEFVGFCSVRGKLVPRFEICESFDEVIGRSLNEFGAKITMNWMEKYEDYLSRARSMIEAGDELHGVVLELRRNPANVDDLIHSGYLAAKVEEAYDEANRLLNLSENALRERAQELGVEVAL